MEVPRNFLKCPFQEARLDLGVESLQLVIDHAVDLELVVAAHHARFEKLACCLLCGMPVWGQMIWIHDHMTDGGLVPVAVMYTLCPVGLAKGPTIFKILLAIRSPKTWVE